MLVDGLKLHGQITNVPGYRTNTSSEFSMPNLIPHMRREVLVQVLAICEAFKIMSASANLGISESSFLEDLEGQVDVRSAIGCMIFSALEMMSCGMRVFMWRARSHCCVPSRRLSVVTFGFDLVLSIAAMLLLARVDKSGERLCESCGDASWNRKVEDPAGCRRSKSNIYSTYLLACGRWQS